MADVVRYMEGQGAGQCGPCVHGLAELAETMDRLAYGGRGGPHLDRILEICTLVEGRGACRHPDGVARFVRTGLGVFADEVASHQRRGPCPQTRAARVLPVAGRTASEKAGEPGMSRWSLELVLDPVACDGRGVCAEMLPERIELDRWGYPVIDGAEIAPALFEHAVRAVRSCPKQALHLVERSVLSPPLEDLDEREPGSPSTRTARRVRWSRSRVHRRRRVLAVIGAVLAALLIWLAVSIGGALTNPALGSSAGSRLAEWFREHGGASVVNWAENEWYSHHQPKVGGALPPGTIHKPKTVTTAPAAATVAHLPPPAPIAPLASPPDRGRGAVVAGRPSRRRRARGLRDADPAQRDPHQLRRGGGMDGPDAPQGDAVLGQSDSRRRTLHAHRTHFAHRLPPRWWRRSTPAF